MSGGDERQQFLRVLDSLTDDFFSLSDDEVIAEVAASGDDPAALIELVRQEAAKALAAAGKARLSKARKQLDQVRSLRSQAPVLALSPREKEAILHRFAANDSPLQARLTMAARSGQSLTEAEVDTVLLDLVELGALDSAGKMR